MDLTDFLKTSDYYVCSDGKEYFLGNFYIDYNHIDKLHYHFINTNENLINNYVKIVHLSWDQHSIIFKEQKEYLEYSLNKMRELEIFDSDFYVECKILIKKGYDKYNSWLLKSSGKPRRDAQIFISKKNVREFIFKRDNYKCLCCGTKENLSIDHIQAVNKKGKNQISNLQTLCKSCNSKKSDKFKDYR